MFKAYYSGPYRIFMQIFKSGFWDIITEAFYRMIFLLLELIFPVSII